MTQAIDRIFDAAVEFADQALDVPADAAETHSRYHRKYVAGVHWVEAGVFLGAAGLAAAAEGAEVGWKMAGLSLILAHTGTVKAIINCDHFT
jgi:hypothetical protein